jgi:hypothetical protein
LDGILSSEGFASKIGLIDSSFSPPPPTKQAESPFISHWDLGYGQTETVQRKTNQETKFDFVDL